MINLIEESEEENDIQNKFHINLEAERNIWWKTILGNYIPKV